MTAHGPPLVWIKAVLSSSLKIKPATFNLLTLFLASFDVNLLAIPYGNHWLPEFLSSVP